MLEITLNKAIALGLARRLQPKYTTDETPLDMGVFCLKGISMIKITVTLKNGKKYVKQFENVTNAKRFLTFLIKRK